MTKEINGKTYKLFNQKSRNIIYGYYMICTILFTFVCLFYNESTIKLLFAVLMMGGLPLVLIDTHRQTNYHHALIDKHAREMAVINHEQWKMSLKHKK